MSVCAGCGAEIEWVNTPAGKAMPCDVKPVAVWGPPKTAVLIVNRKGESIACSDKTTVRVLTPHWVTCTHADKFRRK